MRDLSFRAWDNEEQKMYHVVSIDFARHEIEVEYEAFRTFCAKFDDPNMFLMQYIGIKDKNGREIYEMDIVHLKHVIFKDCKKQEIERIDEHIGCVIIWKNGWALQCENHYFPLFWATEADEFEIIGNYYTSILELEQFEEGSA